MNDIHYRKLTDRLGASLTAGLLDVIAETEGDPQQRAEVLEYVVKTAWDRVKHLLDEEERARFARVVNAFYDVGYALADEQAEAESARSGPSRR